MPDKIEPWNLRSYLALKASGKPMYYFLLGEDECHALAAGVVLARTQTAAQEALETLDEAIRRIQARGPLNPEPQRSTHGKRR